jgi:hypothetical protein
MAVSPHSTDQHKSTDFPQNFSLRWIHPLYITLYTLSLQLTLFCLYRTIENFQRYQIMLSILNRALQTSPKSIKLLSLKGVLTDGTEREEQKPPMKLATYWNGSQGNNLGRQRNGFIELGTKSWDVCFEHDNKDLVFIRDEQFLGQTSKYYCGTYRRGQKFAIYIRNEISTTESTIRWRSYTVH